MVGYLMVKYFRQSLLLFLFLSVSFVHAGALSKLKELSDSTKRHVRDFCVEEIINIYYVYYSDKVVEVDGQHYPELNNLVIALSAKAGIKKPLTFVITKKFPGFWDKVNAFTSGDKECSVLFIGSWLLDKMTKEELEAAVAHEISHLTKNHATKYVTLYVGISALGIVAAYMLAKWVQTSSFWSKIPEKYAECKCTGFDISVTAEGINKKIAITQKLDFTVSDVSVNSSKLEQILSDFKAHLNTKVAFKCGLPITRLFLVMLGLTSTASSLIRSYFSRRCEQDADLGSVDLTGHKKQINALQKLDEIYNKYSPYSTWLASLWFVRIFTSHPQTKDRVAYIEKYIPAQPVSPEAAA